MALTVSVSSKEMERVAIAAYHGKRVRVSLANMTSQAYTSDTAVALWDAIKLTGNGYADYTAVIATGGYDATDGRFEMGQTTGANTFIEAVFTASGVGYTFNSIYVVIGTSNGSGGWNEENYVHSVLTENPAIVLSSGSTVKYNIQLAIDN